MGMQNSKERMINIEIRDLKLERKNLQLELTLEQLCDNDKQIFGPVCSHKRGYLYRESVHQPSTADRKRILEIKARLNDIYRELFNLEEARNKLTNTRILRPVLRWDKFLSGIELHWV
jgi:hypothetical protein